MEAKDSRRYRYGPSAGMHGYWLKGLGISLRSAGSAVSGVSWTYYALVNVFGFMLPALISYELQKPSTSMAPAPPTVDSIIPLIREFVPTDTRHVRRLIGQDVIATRKRANWRGASLIRLLTVHARCLEEACGTGRRGRVRRVCRRWIGAEENTRRSWSAGTLNSEKTKY